MANRHPLCAAGRGGMIATRCIYSNAAGPNFRASVQRAVNLAQGYDLKSAPSRPTPASASSTLAGVRGQHERSAILTRAILAMAGLR